MPSFSERYKQKYEFKKLEELKYNYIMNVAGQDGAVNGSIIKKKRDTSAQ